MKTPLLIILAILAGIAPVYSQHCLESKNNKFRSGDEIVKQQVSYKDPGRPGENVLWDFSNLDVIDEEYKLSYYPLNDSLITGVERHTVYYYSLSNDSLLLCGFENPASLITYQQPVLQLYYPVCYGNRTYCYFAGNGKYYDRLGISSMGTVETHADAYGMIILPGKDTLKNVIRIRTLQKFSDTLMPVIRSRKDSVCLVTSDSIGYRLATTPSRETEIYRWYAKGYRYPVFETVRNATQQYGETTLPVEVSFFFPPAGHTYLENDENNPVGLRENTNAGENDFMSRFSYNLYPNPVKDNLEIEMYLPEISSVYITISDRQGRLIHSSQESARPEGIYQLRIPMLGYVVGEYALRITLQEKYIVSSVIFKR